jgi:hypothetical protein
MPDINNLFEIDSQIAIIRANLSALSEQAVARSGAQDEEFAADRIAEQETKLTALIKQRETLSKSKS